MAKWTVEMTYSIPISLRGVEADTHEGAMKKALKMMDENPHMYADLGEARPESIDFVNKEGDR